MNIIPRRSFLKGILASPLAALGLGRARAAGPAVEALVAPLKPLPPPEVGPTGFLQIFSGKPPVPGCEPTGTLLCSLPFRVPDEPVDWLRNPPSMEGTATATGTPGYARRVEVGPDGELRTVDRFTCGVGAGDIRFNSIVVAGGMVSINKPHSPNPSPNYDPDPESDPAAWDYDGWDEE